MSFTFYVASVFFLHEAVFGHFYEIQLDYGLS